MNEDFFFYKQTHPWQRTPLWEGSDNSPLTTKGPKNSPLTTKKIMENWKKKKSWYKVMENCNKTKIMEQNHGKLEQKKNHGKLVYFTHPWQRRPLWESSQPRWWQARSLGIQADLPAAPPVRNYYLILSLSFSINIII